MQSRRAIILGAAAGLAASASGARAQGFPDRPVRIVVAFPPGGNADFTARLLLPAMSRSLGQPVVVDNRPGAGGIVGTEAVARAQPDGYTLLLGSTGPISLFPVARSSMPYDSLRDLAPVGIAYRVPIALLVGRQVQARTPQELVALSQNTRGGLSAGSSGIGSGAHLAIELFNHGSGAGVVHVPYRGTGPAYNDLIAGTIPMLFDQLSTALPVHQDGRARILAIASASRSPLLPEVPTLREAGLVEPELSTTLGLLAPAGTPAPVIAKLRSALAAAMGDATVRDRLSGLGAEIPSDAQLTPERYAEVIREEMESSRQAVRLGNISLD
jgi:tripartite-type tricarboxylate transporter receptor subunit TctC